MAPYPTLLRYFGYFFKLQNQYPFGYILDCRIRGLDNMWNFCYKCNRCLNPLWVRYKMTLEEVVPWQNPNITGLFDNQNIMFNGTGCRKAYISDKGSTKNQNFLKEGFKNEKVYLSCDVFWLFCVYLFSCIFHSSQSG